MTSLASPSTPRSPAFVSAPSTPSTPPLGSWRHPLMDEVARRQNTFNDASLVKLTYNSVALVVSFVLVKFLSKNETALSFRYIFPSVLLNNVVYIIWALRLLFFYNIVSVGSNLLQPTSDLADLPLTREQRALLGLNPDTPATAPAESFFTPPRYIKSAPSSPFSAPSLSSPTMQRKGASTALESPHSPINSSPLRMGMGVPRPVWGSPRSPKNQSVNSVIPNSRWAYEKSILTRKPADGVRISPSKNLFESPR